NPSSSCASSNVSSVGDWAFTCTPCDWRRFVRLVLSQNDGTSVENNVVDLADSSSGGYLTGDLNVPWIESPFDEIDCSWPAVTCDKKNGLKGPFTRVWPSGLSMTTRSTLRASNATTAIQNRIRRWGAGGVGGGGVPRPSGAGDTPHPPGSRIGGGGRAAFDVARRGPSGGGAGAAGGAWSLGMGAPVAIPLPTTARLPAAARAPGRPLGGP